jgi:hypothetical protein
MLQLKSTYREAILADVELQVKIAKSTHKTIETVKRWARNNESMLMLLPVLQSIKTHLKLHETEVITEEVEQGEAV